MEYYGSDEYNNCRIIKRVLENTYSLLSSNPACNYSHNTVTRVDVYMIDGLCNLIYNSQVLQGSYSKPMLWIGIYIALASLLCVLVMAADLFHGFRYKKLWFPSKFFTLNVASIMVITVAMKLPVDLSGPMPGQVDQMAKMASLAFMTTMMANLMPSLASMDDTKLFSNVVGLIILIVTVVVNVLIQINTGVVYYVFFAYLYIGTMLYLLLILISLSLTSPASKKILEIKYQAAHKMASKDIHPQHTRMSTVEELIQRIRRYSVMAGTCSPQFVMATTPLCSAAGIICISSTMAYIYYVVKIFTDSTYGNYTTHLLDYESDYKWSMIVIFITQSFGIVVGTVAPAFRCFAALRFKFSLKWFKKHTNIFEVESYWIRKLSEWKVLHLGFPFSSRTIKAIVCNTKSLILDVCIVFQKAIVISCKTLALIPVGIVIIGVHCVSFWNSLKAIFVLSRETRHDLEQNDNTDEDIGNYVLQLQDEMELGTRTLKSIINSVNLLIQKAEKKLPNNLLKLVEQSVGFGVVNFDSDQVQPLTSIEFPDSWSLPVVNLTCIAMTLPDIYRDHVDSMFSSVREGLSYTFLIEESLNNVGEAKNIQRASKKLWDQVEVSNKWLGNTLQRNDFKEKKPTEILEWFSKKAEEIVLEINKSNNEEISENSQNMLIAANSMYRINQTIMLKYHNSECIRSS